MSTRTVTRPVRVESPERWQKALQRALDNGVKAFQIAGTGQWVATSTSRPGVCYTVTTTDCECEAALAGDPVCQHRAALRCELGTLWPDAPTPDPEPEPPAPAPVAPRVPVWASMLAAADGRRGADAKESRRRRRERAAIATY